MTTEHRTCTIEKPDGSFCDGPPVPLAPFPICARHLTDAHLFVLSITTAPNPKAADAQADVDRRREESAQVYYAREPGGTVKIGHSIQVRLRLQQLRLPLDALLATEPGGPVLERMRHAQFAHLRRGRTESFDVADDLLSHVAMLLEHYGPPRL